ncbi:class I SAM-dependent methyltransferase [Acinetobacter sp. AGC35]
MEFLNDYWNDFYSSILDNSRINIPSQFSIFFLSDINYYQNIVLDIGCGNGRDSIFFAKNGIFTIGIDASEEAINICKNYNMKNAMFINSSIDDLDLIDQVKRIKQDLKKEIIVYSRFFLHAIDENKQNSFFKLIDDILPIDGKVYLEFRTENDKFGEKNTKDHYRRYINVSDFKKKALSKGYEIKKYYEGHGYANFLNDDAYVARLVLKKIGVNYVQ